MTSCKITVRGIFNDAGELVRFLYSNGGGKSYFMDCEPSKDSSIDEFFMEMMPPQDKPPIIPIDKTPNPSLPPDSTLV
jgi:hypothetical protein